MVRTKDNIHWTLLTQEQRRQHLNNKLKELIDHIDTLEGAYIVIFGKNYYNSTTVGMIRFQAAVDNLTEIASEHGIKKLGL